MSSKCIVIVFRNWQKNLLRWTMLCLFLVYFNLSHTILQNKIADISGIRTRIVKMKGQHGDHLTTITTILKMAEYRYLIWIILQEAHYPLTLFRYGMRDSGKQSDQIWPLWPDVRTICPFWNSLARFWPFETVWQNFELTLANCVCQWQFLMLEMVKYFTNNPAIWSHWCNDIKATWNWNGSHNLQILLVNVVQ